MTTPFELFHLFFIKVTIIDIFDILVVSFILYKLYFFLRGSRAAQMAVGLILILIVSLLAQLFNMVAMSWLFQNLRTVWLIAFVVIFQPELRRMLTHLGQSRLVRFFFKVTQSHVIDELIKAVGILAKHSFGALIVLIRNTGMKSVVETGVRLQAEISSQLLVSIFNPRSPLHDGAVVVQDEVIEAAKCILPLSQDEKIDPDLGTRHRAGLGMAEESDAFVIIVSEERGTISIANNGRLTRDISLETLRDRLTKAMKVVTDS
jgi:diadenylate cyclase